VLADVKAALLVRPELVQVGRGKKVIEVVAARESSDEWKRNQVQVEQAKKNPGRFPMWQCN
jgi:hypothetical protein